MEEEILVAMELGRTSAAFRSLIGTNNGIGSSGIVIDGTEEQNRNTCHVMRLVKSLVHSV